MTKPTFAAGLNIAMKIPLQRYDATVAFYRDTLGFTVEEQPSTGAATVSRTHKVAFGPSTLWLDCVDSYSQPDVWLELRTDDLDAATDAVAAAGIQPCDEVEILEGGEHRSHWITNPAGIIHLLAETSPDH